MSKPEMQALTDLIELIRQADEYDDALKRVIIARLKHNFYLKYLNEADVFNTSLPLSERIEAFLTPKHDAMYGNAFAHRFGFQSNEGILRYDVLRMPEELDMARREPFVRYLRNLGCRAMLSEHTPAQDGLNHYNVYSNAKTIVGRMASNFESAPNAGFDTPHGKFRTLEGYYHVLRLVDYFASCEDLPEDLSGKDRIAYDLGLLTVYSKQYPAIDDLYRLDGAECIQVGRAVKRDVYGGTRYRPGAFSAHAERCFMTAMVQKLHLLQYENRCLGNVLAEIVQQGVKLDHYYVMQGRVIRPKFSEWLPDLITRIVELIDPYASTFDPNQVIHQLE